MHIAEVFRVLVARRMGGEDRCGRVMVTTMVYDFRARLRSYELLAEAFGLRGCVGAEGDGECE